MSIKVLEIAQGEIGYLEKASNAQLDDKTANAGHSNYTKYARDLATLGAYNASKQGFAWCDMFVDWCFVRAYGFKLGFEMTCQPIGYYGAGCTESANYYKAKGRLHKTGPQPGDQIFFTNDGGKTMYHTGLVIEVAGNIVHTIEGNTSSAAGVVDNGGGVFAKSYNINSSSIGGYGRPNYDLVQNETEEPTVKYKTIKDVPDWAREAVLAAMGKTGIDGKAVLQGDGEGNIDLSEDLLRVIVMNYRLGLY